jgi:hypothetical protein
MLMLIAKGTTMKQIYSTTLLLLCCMMIRAQKAVITVPVADLLGQPMTTLRPNQPVHDAYNAIAFCGGQTNSHYACPRLHQILYNDSVDVIKMTDDEAQISITHAYYVTPSSPTPQTSYWTLKKNITLLDDLTTHAIDPTHLPDAIHFTDSQHTALLHPNIITLTMPHHDATLNITFSAGTRFVRAPTDKKEKKSVHVFAIDYPAFTEHRITVPLHKCIITDHSKTNQERIIDYVHLLQQWAHTKQGCIPYTLGGTSFIHPMCGNFKEVTHTTTNGDYSAYEYDKNSKNPKSGLDCSGAVVRAAQICGIPYFAKNTTTISHCLSTVAHDQQLHEGDLIVVKGHVMVVSDVAKNLLIEARSYAHGYGKLQEIPLGNVFENVATYDDLMNIYINKKPIQRKDKQGKIRDTFSNVQLYGMMSAWKKNNNKKAHNE